MVLMYPFVLLSQLIAKAIKRSDEPTVERSEVVALAEIGRREGVFSLQEAKILTNIIKLRSITVRDIMTPRTVMVAAREDMTIGEFQADKTFHRYSRIPLYKSSKDNITGFIHKHDLLHIDHEKIKTETTLLKSLSRPLPVIHQYQNLYSTYQFMVQESAHIALVVEEFGGTAGLVTMEDIIETLLGMEIMDEFDDTKDMREYARARWRDRAARMGLKMEGNNIEETTN
jgi:CBS domain containing-hemolysin-like protein